jgi:sugar-specific transcriptional regulator TrmB
MRTLLDSKDELVSNRLDELHSMGLTHQEAVVYTSLLSLGPSHARAVCKDAHLTREDTYRILRGLEAKALVQIIIGKPSTFVAIEPRSAVKTFVSQIDARSTELKQRAYGLGEWLERVSTFNGREGHHDEAISVKLLFGHQIIEETIRLLGQCRSEHVAVMTGRGFAVSSQTGYLDYLSLAVQRGIRVRFVTEVNQANRQAVSRFSRKFEVRHHEDLDRMMSFSISDGSAVTLALTDLADIDEARAICANSPTLVGGFRSYFEQIWGGSTAVSS